MRYIERLTEKRNLMGIYKSNETVFFFSICPRYSFCDIIDTISPV